MDRLLRGYPTLIIRTALAFDQDDGAVQSRSIAYYALFSIFPLLLVIMSFSTKLLTSEQAEELVLSLMQSFIPAFQDMLEKCRGLTSAALSVEDHAEQRSCQKYCPKVGK